MEKIESNKQEKSVLENIREISKVAALSALMIFFGNENALAQNKKINSYHPFSIYC